MSKTYGVPIIFGVPDPLPSVPEGWEILPNDGSGWLMCKDRSGKVYFLGYGCAYPRGVFKRDTGANKKGDPFIHTNCGVKTWRDGP